GNVIGSGMSKEGLFSIVLSAAIPDGAIYMESSSGSYVDEATGETVSPTGGLMTVFTSEEFKAMMKAGAFAALTPETTILSKIVKQKITAGTMASTAITEAITLIETAFIADSNPTNGMVSGDTVLRKGNLVTPFAAFPEIALAKNRAISFSYLAKNLGVAPVKVFDLMISDVKDLEDGVLDGKDNAGAALTIVNSNGDMIDLSKRDRKSDITVARQKLFQNTLTRLSEGNLTDEEKAQLRSQLSGDSNFSALIEEQMAKRDQQIIDAQAAIAAQLLLTDLVELPMLAPLADEDNDIGNNAATYTLNANKDVPVTVKLRKDNVLQSITINMLRYNDAQLPPMIVAKRGEQITASINNQLGEETTVHWHGFKIPASVDGGPDNPISAGGSFTPVMILQQPAAPLWFHPHPHSKTGEQVYNGLAGIFIIKDDITNMLETSNELPTGAYDIPLLIQDRRFSDVDNDGTLDAMDYATSPMDLGAGMLGNHVLVNGVELPKKTVETRQYRFRLYNVSNARTYNFALNDGMVFKVIGTDGGLLNRPVSTTELLLAPAERAEIVIDFSSYAVGDEVMLISKSFVGNQMGMMGSTMGGMSRMDGMGGMNGMNMSMPNGAEFSVMRFDVTTQVTDPVTLFTTLPSSAEINTRWAADVSATTATRKFVMAMGGMDNMQSTEVSGGGNQMNGMSFTINGKSFDMNRVDETITTGGAVITEVWEVTNMSMMAHPFHAHAIQYQVLSRNGVDASGTDLGWKDTVLVAPGQTVKLVGKFDPSISYGKYMYHCHILEHEDNGMMGIFEVVQ
ncbi:MAG: multicopper oxidase domain-containing protein, partial [Gammaproteobacteria bacterium]|nr:multicopper oxidase domain-containing protein [Gammaproteobacteria bacterium]